MSRWCLFFKEGSKRCTDLMLKAVESQKGNYNSFNRLRETSEVYPTQKTTCKYLTQYKNQRLRSACVRLGKEQHHRRSSYPVLLGRRIYNNEHLVSLITKKMYTWRSLQDRQENVVRNQSPNWQPILVHMYNLIMQYF